MGEARRRKLAGDTTHKGDAYRIEQAKANQLAGKRRVKMGYAPRESKDGRFIVTSDNVIYERLGGAS